MNVYVGGIYHEVLIDPNIFGNIIYDKGGITNQKKDWITQKIVWK